MTTPSGSGGPLLDDHVICPACAHNFGATSPADAERIRKLKLQAAMIVSELERGVREALREFDASMEALAGCTDNGCMIRRRTPNRGGMGTNGGCKCGHDKHVASRYMAATTRLIKDIEAALDA